MSGKCRYGDEESVELIECTVDPVTGSVSCPAPRHRATAPSNKELDLLEMDVGFLDEQGEMKLKTMVLKHGNDHERQPLVNGLDVQDDGLDKPLHGNRHLRAAVMLLAALGGELIGTFMLTLVICSAVSTAVLSGALVGIWQVAVVCGMGVAISIYSVSYFSDAHLNPAITLAFAVVRYKSFSWKRVPLYILAQLLGGILAGAVLLAFNGKAISLYERENGIERGENASVITAMMFGEYFPNPLLYSHSDPNSAEVESVFGALAVEAWTTGILSFVVFSLTDRSNASVGRDSKPLAPLMIGLTVSVLISTYGHLTQVGMNPARDLGPRLVAACAGWGTVAVPGPRGGFWVYVVGPMVGGVAGAALNGWVIAKAVKVMKKWREEEDHQTRLD